ncbi:MFS transporter [Chloroflexota bacterium]
MAQFKNLRKVFHQWGGITAVFFAYTHLSHDIYVGLLVALLPFIKADLGLSYLQSGLLLSAYAITSGLSQFLGGWLGDRVSRQTVLVIGLGGVSLSAVAIGLTSAYHTMLVILVIMGFFSGAYHPSATAMLSGYFEEARRGKAIALHLVGGSFGFAMGPVLGGLIAGILGWRLAFIILSIPIFVAIPLVLKKLKQQEHPAHGEPVDHAPTRYGSVKLMERGTSLGQILRPIAVVTTLAILTQFVGGSALAFLPLYLVGKHSIDPAYAAMLLSVIRSGGIAGSLLGGWLSDRWGRKNAIFLALVATGPLLYLTTKLPFNPVLVVAFIIFCMVMLMRQAAIQPLLMDSTPPEFRSTVFGLYFGLSMEGSSLTQPLAGHFMDVFGIVDVFHVIALISIALSLGALLLLKWPKVRR